MFYVHERFMDVFVEVLKVQYRGPDYRKIKVRWWNYGYDGSNPWCVYNKPQVIQVNNNDWNLYWKYFNPATDKHPGR